MLRLLIEVIDVVRRKLKKNVITAIYFCVAIFLVVSIFLIQRSLTNGPSPDRNYLYVMKNILDQEIPVVGEKTTLLKPFIHEGVVVKRGFYDYLAENTKQENALIFHDNTYMQNSGVDFGGASAFDIVAVLDGIVTEVKEDALLGKIIELRHGNDLISSYQSLSETKVNKGDTVMRGQIIGKSGQCNIAKDLGDHLHFELYHQGQVVSPLDYFDKKIE